ncbi:hypothetical protein [Nitrososphaera sp. AFS]|uniref:hypothetical protein n=1 Tax=Nitrososphaera sp. AFS TaxID=2301191 RepID=UPI001392276C|nr:hypothetical protein [Nitrososphaera sp. AFS]NAL78417.1 hypothetical protein [Nitrososphaera sp. AFS]
MASSLSPEINENETIVTIRLPKWYYRTAWHISKMLGYGSFEQYVNDAFKQNLTMQLDGAGELDVKAFFERINKQTGQQQQQTDKSNCNCECSSCDCPCHHHRNGVSEISK